MSQFPMHRGLTFLIGVVVGVCFVQLFYLNQSINNSNNALSEISLTQHGWFGRIITRRKAVEYGASKEACAKTVEASTTRTEITTTLAPSEANNESSEVRTETFHSKMGSELVEFSNNDNESSEIRMETFHSKMGSELVEFSNNEMSLRGQKKSATRKAAIPAVVTKKTTDTPADDRKNGIYNQQDSHDTSSWLSMLNGHRSTCQVRFKDPNFYLCNWTPRLGLNFGEDIGPAIIRRILENHFQCSTDLIGTLSFLERQELSTHDDSGHQGGMYRCLLSVGNGLQMAMEGDHVWGSNIPQHPTQIHANKNITFHSVRGPKSEAFLRENNNVPGQIPETLGHGDPSFLIPYLYPEYMEIKEKQEKIRMQTGDITCVAPLMSDINTYWFKHLTEHIIPNTDYGIRTLLPGEHWAIVVSEMAACTRVVASSLQALIVADALGIPSLWVSSSSSTELSLKYEDYYESIPSRRNMNIKPVSPLEWMEGDIRQNNQRLFGEPIAEMERNEIVYETIKSFPLHLFEAVDNSNSANSRMP